MIPTLMSPVTIYINYNTCHNIFWCKYQNKGGKFSYINGSQSVVPGLAVSASLGNLLEMQIPGPNQTQCVRLNASETGGRAQQSVF